MFHPVFHGVFHAKLKWLSLYMSWNPACPRQLFPSDWVLKWVPVAVQISLDATVGPQIHMKTYTYPIINYSQERQKYVNKFSLEWKLFLMNFYNLLYAFYCLKSINIIMNGSHLIEDLQKDHQPPSFESYLYSRLHSVWTCLS